MNLFFDFSEKNPYKILGIAIIVTVFMGFGITQVSMSEERDEFLPNDYTSYKVSKAYENAAGELITETILIEGKDLDSAGSFKHILNLTSKISTNENLENYVLETKSYPQYLIPHLRDRFENWRKLPDQKLEQAIDNLLDRSVVRNRVSRYLSENRNAAVITLIINNELSESTLSDKTDRLHQITDRHDENLQNFTLGNTGTISRDGAVKDAMIHDLQLLIPIAGLFIIVVLYFAFRRFLDTVLPFLVLGVGAIWMVGTMGLSGIPFYSNFTILVPLLLGIGIDYTIHLLNRYYEERSEGKNSERSALNSVKTVGIAIFLTALTTIIGFSSFGISDMAPIRGFGFVAGLGVFYVLMLANTVLPSLLVIRDRGGDIDEERKGSWGEDRIGKALGKMEDAIFGHSKTVLVVAGLVTVLAIFPVMSLSTTMSSDIMMPEGAGAVETQDSLDEYFGGYGSSNKAYILAEGQFSSPAALRTIENLKQSIISDPKNNSLIVSTSSIVDLIERSTDGQIPQSEGRISEILIKLESQHNARYERFVLSENKTAIYFTFGASTMDEKRDATEMMKNHVEAFVEEENAEIDFTLEGDPAVSGMPVIFSDISKNIKPDLISSILLAIVLVVIVLTIVFRSVLLGILGALPVSLTLTWELGLLGGLGIPLNIMNMLVSAIAIGVGVDFTIHIMHRFKEEWKEKNKRPREAISKTVQSTGRAILSAAATTIGVFVIISFSSTPMLVSFGWLSAVVITFSLVGSLIILPLILFRYAKHRDESD